MNSTRQLNNQINDTKEQIQNNFKQVSLQNKVQVTEIVDLKITQGKLEQQINSLNFKIKDLEDREKAYREAEELYEQNFQDIAEQTFDTTRFLEELRNSSISQELNSKGTQTTLDLQQILKRNNDQADLISALQKKNIALLDTRRIRISNMGLGAGLSHGAGAGPSGLNTIRVQQIKIRQLTQPY